jgi:anthranilate/para-aminobenzoate synthase component I
VFARTVAVSPDPVSLAFALADRPDLVVLHDAAGGASASFVASDAEGEIDALDPMMGAGAPRNASELTSVPAFVGVLPYETFRDVERPRWSAPEDRPLPLLTRPRWLKYPAVLRVDAARGEVMAVGSSRGAVDDLARRCVRRPRPLLTDVELNSSEADTDAEHEARVRAAIELIHAGDLYQVNIARRFSLLLRQSGACPTIEAFAELYARLAHAAPSAFGVLIHFDDAVVVGTSPELCLSADPRPGAGFGRVVTEPIKGTRPRGKDAVSDRALSLELDVDEKERAELAMIIDVERNDLSRVCDRRSVRLLGAPRIVTHRTIHHRVARVAGVVQSGLTRSEVLRSFLPSGSVTGAPKIRAMEVIRTLEASRRGLYTGALGYVSHAGGLVLAMAIRTAVFRPDGTGDYFAGGGIVADSLPKREVAETHWKAAQLAKIACRTL